MAATIALAASSVPAAGASAATYYVDKDSRGGACSDARTTAQVTLRTPWCTIPRAVALAPAGSTIAVRAGHYPRVVLSDVVRSDYVTITSHVGERPYIYGMTLTNVQRLRFTGLDITHGSTILTSRDVQFVGNRVDVQPSGRTTPSGFNLKSVQDAVFERNLIRDTRDGINIIGSRPGSTRIRIVRNHFDHLGNDGVHLATGTSYIDIVGNEFDTIRPRADIDSSSHADSIQAIAPSSYVTVTGNHVHGGRGFLFMVSPADQDRPGFGHFDTVIANNLLVGYAFQVRMFSMVDASLVNNTIWGMTNGTGTGLAIYSRTGTQNARSSGVVMANNILKQLEVGSGVGFELRDYQLILNGPVVGRYEVRGAPSFADLGAGDYHLTPSSHGVDDALATAAPPRDLEGSLRSGPPDLGALELDK